MSNIVTEAFNFEIALCFKGVLYENLKYTRDLKSYTEFRENLFLSYTWKIFEKLISFCLIPARYIKT